MNEYFFIKFSRKQLYDMRISFEKKLKEKKRIKNSLKIKVFKTLRLI
jgi:hypothetical protein